MFPPCFSPERHGGFDTEKSLGGRGNGVMISGPNGNGVGPLPPDGMYHVNDSINGIHDSSMGGSGLIADKVREETAEAEDDGCCNEDEGSNKYRRLPSSTCV